MGTVSRREFLNWNGHAICISAIVSVSDLFNSKLPSADRPRNLRFVLMANTESTWLGGPLLCLYRIENSTDEQVRFQWLLDYDLGTVLFTIQEEGTTNVRVIETPLSQARHDGPIGRPTTLKSGESYSSFALVMDERKNKFVFSRLGTFTLRAKCHLANQVTLESNAITVRVVPSSKEQSATLERHADFVRRVIQPPLDITQKVEAIRAVEAELTDSGTKAMLICSASFTEYFQKHGLVANTELQGIEQGLRKKYGGMVTDYYLKSAASLLLSSRKWKEAEKLVKLFPERFYNREWIMEQIQGHLKYEPKP